MPPPPFPFSLSAASRVLLLTLIPNRCCHFCLASAPDYTTGVCHKNPLSPVSSTQHKDQLLQMKRDIRDFNNIAFSLSLSLFCCCCCHSLSLLPFVLLSLAIVTASLQEQRQHMNFRWCRIAFSVFFFLLTL